MGAVDAQKKQSPIPICTIDELAEVDAIIFGTPTRFGNMCGQMRQFLDSTGKLWLSGAQVGMGINQGMVIVGLFYVFKGQMTKDEITGCSPYGSSTFASTDGSRFPSDNELAGARFQGEHVAKIAKKLTA